MGKLNFVQFPPNIIDRLNTISVKSLRHFQRNKKEIFNEFI